jgi:putative ABC transport system permease protein
MDMGFRSENVLLASLDPAKSGYDRQKIVRFFDELMQRIRQQPGIIEAGLASHGSLSGVLPSGMRFLNTTMHAEGYGATSGEEMNFYNNFVTPGYFPAVGIQILRGRNFGQHDRQGSAKVAIVNEAAARHWFKDEDPIGKHIGMGMSGPSDIEIVGVVKDAKYANVREKPLRTVYLPFHQSPGSPMTMHIKSIGEPRTVIPIVQREVRALDTNIPIFQAQTMSARVDDALSQERLITTLATVLAILGTLLAAIGLYGVVSYSAVQRTREIGIRIALGARHTDLLKLVIGRGMKLAMIGLMLGLVAAVALTRLMNSLLYGVSATDPLTFSFIMFLLTGIALVACYIPARRAAKVDPIVALHTE